MSGFDVYAIVDPTAHGASDRTLAMIATVPPGRVAIQVRAKGHPPEAHATAIRVLAGPARLAGVSLFVSTHVALAAELGIGLHLPEDGPEVSEVRRQVSRIGVSCHDAAGLARRSGADFAVLGPLADVPGKGPALGWAAFADLVRTTAMPVYALGGIRGVRDVEMALRHGARGVAVARALGRDGALPELLSAFPPRSP